MEFSSIFNAHGDESREFRRFFPIRPISRLATLGLLQEITGQKRRRVFRYAPYPDLFADSNQRVET